MASYVVESAGRVKTLPATDQRGELAVHEYVLSAGGRGPKIRVERLAKPQTPLPAVGSAIEGEIEDTKWGKRFKPERAGNSGPRRRDPAETRAIQRQHSQEMALRYIAAKVATGKLANFTFDDVVKLTGAFERDVQPPVIPPSDVPLEDEGLPEPTDLGESDEEIPF